MQNAAVGWNVSDRNAEDLTGQRADLAIAFQARKARPFPMAVFVQTILHLVVDA